MSRRLRITDESYGGDRASFRGSQFFLRREREYSARIPRLQFSDDVIFRIGVSLSRSMLIGWKKKKIRRENPVLSPGEYFSPVESHCYRSRMRLACVPHTHTRARYALDLFMLVWAYETRGLPNVTTPVSSSRHLRKHTHRNNASAYFH